MISGYNGRDKFLTSSASSLFSEHKRRNESSPMSWYSRLKNAAGFWVGKLQESNIHGLKYIGQPDRHIAERIFWMIILCLSIGGAFYMSHSAVLKYLQSPVIISFNPTQTLVSEIPFPAITVCNVNKFKKSSFEQALKIATEAYERNETNEQVTITRMFLRQLDHICSAGKSFSVKFNYSLNATTVNLCHRGIGFPCHHKRSEKGKVTVGQGFGKKVLNMLRKASISCKEMIKLCLWKGDPVPCVNLFKEIITDLGLCCTFNMMPKSLLLRQSAMGVEKNSFLYENLTKAEIKAWKEFNIDETLMNTGYGRSRSNVNRMPYLKYESDAGQNSGLSFVLDPELKEYFCSDHNGYGFRVYAHSPIEYPHVGDFGIAVPPNEEMFMSMQVELTVSERSASWVSIGKRRCYFVGEKPLNSFSQYTLSNCIDECIGEKIIEECHCALVDMPQSKTEADLAYCEEDGFRCSERVKKRIANNGTRKECPDCLQSCSNIQYSTQTSSLPIRDDANIWLKSGKNESWAGNNVTILNVFFGSDIAKSKVRKRLFGSTELFGQVGGVLGLFLGFSVISLVHPLYHIIQFSFYQKSK